MKILGYHTDDNNFIILVLESYDLVFKTYEDWSIQHIKRFHKAGTKQYETYPFDLSNKPDHLLIAIIDGVFKKCQ